MNSNKNSHVRVATKADGEGLFTCGVCNERHHGHSTYACKHEHYFCKKCIKEEYYSGKEKLCPHKFCCLPIHKVDENTIDRKPSIRRKKMFPYPAEISSIRKSLSGTSLLSVQKRASEGSLTALSRKPVNCPYSYCNKSIAVTAFDEHFKYEHKNIPFVETSLDTRNGFQFFPDDVKYNERMCIVVFNITDDSVRDKTSNINIAMSSSQTITITKPVLVVLMARLPLTISAEDDDDEEEVVDSEYGCSPEDKILIWVASNIPTNFSYTLAVSTVCNQIRMKYFGRLLTVNEDCNKLCDEGRGLILSHNHAVGMTENGLKPLALDILIHDDDHHLEI